MTTLCLAESFGWSEILWITLIGFSLVFLMLVLLICIIKLFGAVFTHKQVKSVKAQGVAPEAAKVPQMISGEEIAAITIALSLFTRVQHDEESEVLTIQKIKRAYSPWNSKIHGLTQLPSRNK